MLDSTGDLFAVQMASLDKRNKVLGQGAGGEREDSRLSQQGLVVVSAGLRRLPRVFAAPVK